ncbi:MAG: hypothetical protein L6Q54_05905 [Leptospiraceae bacterium]|nr:hypothetical protein [Leptospiraceae bacterium]MCK6380771.1 hypothetical protein [Leptospiraceae bacterium]NUM41141.1 hypothetical protein [Leptospiraceae bacterium]
MEEQIPQGFTKETWNTLTPEQKRTYLQGAQSNQSSPQNMQNQMGGNMMKQSMLMMVLGFIPTIISMILRMFTGRNYRD